MTRSETLCGNLIDNGRRLNVAEARELDIFIAAAKAGSFARAGREIGISAAGVTRAIAALEKRIGVRLFTRTTRQCRLTSDGELFFERCQPLVQELNDAEDEIRAGRLGPNGLLRVSAPISFGRRHVAPLLARFRAEFPSIDVRLYLTEESNDLISRECDCALRVGAPRKGDFITRRLLRARRAVCASPAYLARHGTPRIPSDLRHHQGVILLRDGELLDRWMFEVDGLMETIQVPASLSSNSGEVTQEWALNGAGVVLKSVWDIERELENGKLVELLGEFSQESADIFIVYPDRRNLPLRVRSFVDFASRELSRYGDRLAEQ
jgi:LysR family transcriptional regulator, transcriptional activator for dmlA